MLVTPSARAHRQRIETELNPGFRHADSARLLADAYALALAVSECTESLELKRDCLDSAVAIREHLLTTLSEACVTRGDVERRFQALRPQHPSWPEHIANSAWQRLASGRLLRDIGDVVWGGGEYWEAIDLALAEEFCRTERIRTLYYPMDARDLREISEVAERLPAEDREAIGAVLSRVNERASEQFAMVVWSVEDVLDAAVRARQYGSEFEPEATWDKAGVSSDWVEAVMDHANSALADRMTEKGWELLEDIVAERLPEGSG